MTKYFFILAALNFAFVSQAHVTVEPKVAPAGGYAKLTFRVPHGCAGSATTQLTVQLPEGVLSVKPQVHPGWKITVKKTPLTKPVTLHGEEVKESISEITWAGGPLPDEYMDEFGVSLKLPDQTGEKLTFPVIQKCEKGEAHWTGMPNPAHAGHAHHHGGDNPAPFLKLEKKK